MDTRFSKWLALGVVLTVVVGVAVLDGHEQPAQPLAAQPPPSLPPPPPEREEPEPAPPVAQEPLAPVDLPPPVLLRRAPKYPVDPEALARETALLDRARSEASSNPELALNSLLEHAQLFPQSNLENDALLIQLEALLRLGHRPQAEELARKLVGHDKGLEKPVRLLLERVRAR